MMRRVVCWEGGLAPCVMGSVVALLVAVRVSDATAAVCLGVVALVVLYQVVRRIG